MNATECDVIVEGYDSTGFASVVPSNHRENTVIRQFRGSVLFAFLMIPAAAFGGIVGIIFVCARIYVMRIHTGGLVTSVTCEQLIRYQ